MKTLGYIISEKKIKGLEPFVKQIQREEDAKEAFPILIVGWDIAKAHKGYKSVIDRKIDDNVYWTFKKTESRVDFEKDLSAFYKVLINNFIGEIDYKYLSYRNITESRLKKMFQYVNSNDCKCIYLSNDMLYVPFNKSVIGVSLRVCEYCGISKEKMLSFVKNTSRIISDKDVEDKSVLKWFQNNRYAMSYMICAS